MGIKRLVATLLIFSCWNYGTSYSSNAAQFNPEDKSQIEITSISADPFIINTRDFAENINFEVKAANAYNYFTLEEVSIFWTGIQAISTYHYVGKQSPQKTEIINGRNVETFKFLITVSKNVPEGQGILKLIFVSRNQNGDIWQSVSYGPKELAGTIRFPEAVGVTTITNSYSAVSGGEAAQAKQNEANNRSASRKMIADEFQRRHLRVIEISQEVKILRIAKKVYFDLNPDYLKSLLRAENFPGMTRAGGPIQEDLNEINQLLEGSPSSVGLESMLKLVKENIAKFDKSIESKLRTVTCIKGKLVKKVTGTNPKCPTGYKVKK